jgi:[ribosomal protein S5]-alanine N-acetyltransferase
MTVQLLAPTLRHERAFLDAVRQSTALHRPWVSAPNTRERYRAYLKRSRKPTQLSYLIRLATGDLAGVINVNEIVRGGFCSAYLGYYAFAPHHGQGNMRAGLELVLAEAFRKQGLHRLEANVQPGNHASLALVKRLGFRREGFSPKYLKIAGRWRDHERWAITSEDWRARRRRG